MIDGNIRIEGLDVIREALNSIEPAVLAALEDIGHTTRSLTLGRTPVGIRKGHAGTLKRSWGRVEKTGGGFSFGNTAPYAHVLELGLYPNVGPRTVQVGDGVFSRQAPGGILGPLIEDPSVLQRIADLVANEIVRGVNRVART
jgi:hypothetical protein